jgi:hypothetical protein
MCLVSFCSLPRVTFPFLLFVYLLSVCSQSVRHVRRVFLSRPSFLFSAHFAAACRFVSSCANFVVLVQLCSALSVRTCSMRHDGSCFFLGMSRCRFLCALLLTAPWHFHRFHGRSTRFSPFDSPLPLPFLSSCYRRCAQREHIPKWLGEEKFRERGGAKNLFYRIRGLFPYAFRLPWPAVSEHSSRTAHAPCLLDLWILTEPVELSSKPKVKKLPFVKPEVVVKSEPVKLSSSAKVRKSAVVKSEVVVKTEPVKLSWKAKIKKAKQLTRIKLPFKGQRVITGICARHIVASCTHPSCASVPGYTSPVGDELDEETRLILMVMLHLLPFQILSIRSCQISKQGWMQVIQVQLSLKIFGIVEEVSCLQVLMSQHG